MNNHPILGTARDYADRLLTTHIARSQDVTEQCARNGLATARRVFPDVPAAFFDAVDAEIGLLLTEAEQAALATL